MPSIRLIPIALVCLVPAFANAQTPASDPAPAPAPAPIAVPEQQPAERHLDFVTVLVRSMERIAATLELDVDMLNQKFKLEGNYYKDTGNRIRLQLNLIGLDDTNSKMLQVCDGKVLWDFQQVLNMQSYRKREIQPILSKLKDPNLDETFRIAIISNLGFGGPEAMLSGLRRAVAFDQMSPETVDGVEVFVLRGQWRDRSNLVGLGGQPLPPTAPLPAYVPTNVAVFVGRIDGWPHKIEMIGKAPLLVEDTREVDKATGRPIGPARKPPKVEPTRVTLRYKPLPVAQISPGLFSWEPPANVPASNIKDETEEFLAMLDQYIQVEIQRKKVEASKAEGGEPLLKARPIEVPTAPDAAPGSIPIPDGSPPK